MVFALSPLLGRPVSPLRAAEGAARPFSSGGPVTDICSCPACGRRLRLPEHAVLREARCPSCGEVFIARPDNPLALPDEQGVQSEPSFPRPTSEPERGEHEPRGAGWAPSRAWEDVREQGPPLPEALSGGGLTTTVVVLLLLNIGASLLAIAVEALRAGRLPDARGGPDVLDLSACLTFLVYLPTAVVFLMWMHRSYKNLLEMGTRGLTYSPGWAVGGFFVPFLNFVRPCQVVQEMWRASLPGWPEDDSRGWHRASGSALVGTWWAFWLISNVYSWVVLRVALDNAQGHDPPFGVTLVGEALSCAAALFAILMVRALRARQEAKLDVLLDRS
jgi:hypothetical protein